MYIMCFWSKRIYEACPTFFIPSDIDNVASSRGAVI